MKKILIILLLFTAIIQETTAQMSDSCEYLNYNREIVTQSKFNKNTLWQNINKWTILDLGKLGGKIKYQDKEEAKLIIQGDYKLNLSDSLKNKEFFSSIKYDFINFDYSYIITIDCKDEKYRISIDELKVGLNEGSGYFTKYSSLRKMKSVRTSMEFLLTLFPTGSIALDSNFYEDLKKINNKLETNEKRITYLNNAKKLTKSEKKEKKKLINEITETRSIVELKNYFKDLVSIFVPKMIKDIEKAMQEDDSF